VLHSGMVWPYKHYNRLERPARTNTLAYYKHSLIKAVKSFITLGSGVNVVKLFSSSLKVAPNKLECLSHQVFFTPPYYL